MSLLPLRKGPLQKVERADELQVWIKRDDLMHPYISGNKGRKLQGYLERAQAEGIGHIVTCGGPYSNHLLATAAACQLLEIRCTLLIRGYQQPENPYRRLCEKFGASVHWLSAAEFEQRRQIAGAKVEGPYLFIDTGGEGPDGESACGLLWDELPFEPDVLVLATATGTTMRGILRGRDQRGIQTKVCGIPVLFNAAEQHDALIACGMGNWELVEGFEAGGYARADDNLLSFCISAGAVINAVLDPVYTGKAWYALQKLLEQHHWPLAKRIVFLHTGGTYGLFTPPFAARLAKLEI
ncbi:MAG: 1-aminocyclopropane-1-carboxylate deaminase/D-cysteine desulfhydrase [Bacteroidota bacterium]